MANESDLKRQGLWDYERDKPLRISMPVLDETLDRSKPDVITSNERVASTFELQHLLLSAQIDVNNGVPLDSHLIAANLLAAICRELLHRRAAETFGDAGKTKLAIVMLERFRDGRLQTANGTHETLLGPRDQLLQEADWFDHAARVLRATVKTGGSQS